VFLDELPICTGTNRGKINWKASVGYKIRFIYGNIENEVEIINYYEKAKRRYLEIKYNNDISSIIVNDFRKCQIGEIIGENTKKFKYKINEIVKTKTGEIKILKQVRILQKERSFKGYEYECLIDKYVSQIREDHLHNGVGCSVCAGQTILKGYNDLWTTNPEVCQLMKYPERGYEISRGSCHKLEIFICPHCGFEKSQRIADVVKRRLSCSKCSDGISYPNKFVYNFLDQLKEIYISEYSPDWIGNKRYDIFLPNKNEVWEIHGMQHYKQASWTNNARKTIKSEQENDRYKKELAKQNGYKYIEIDARCSEMEYIKNSLLNISELKRYDLNNVDWLQCHKIACSSLVIIACNYWNDGIKNTKEIGKIMKLGFATIIRYLKKGVELGWCDYDPKEVLKGNARMIGRKYKDKRFKNMKNIIQLSKERLFIREWQSMTEAEKELGISLGSISPVCSGKRKSAGGFKWMYKKDYEQYIKDINE
jgi:hypothetical protein